MRTRSFYFGVFFFGTLTVMCLGLFEVDLYFHPQPLARYFAPEAAGVLLGLASLIYFYQFGVAGSFLRFSTEYWLAGATSYLLVNLIAIGIEVSREQGLFSIESWSHKLPILFFPRGTILLALGVGITLFGYVATKYNQTKGK
jgi:hypothetical protein